MASNPKSRWADEESPEAIRQRKREKEEKKRAKEEKQRKLREEEEARVKYKATIENIQTENVDTSERPSKRRRTSNDETQPAQPSLLRFPAQHLQACGDVEDYERLNDIEEGSYGLVSRAKNSRTGQIVALKKLKMDYANDGFPVTGLREIQTLKSCQHPNIVPLLEVVMGSTLKDVYLVMEFLSHDLKALLDDLPEPFLPSEIKTLMQQLASGISFLHSRWIMHRDLKTSNLLINNRGELKIADFGMARYTGSPPPKLTATVVTLWYRSPELLLGEESYDFSIDIWSLGCIFSELITRTPLFSGKNEVDQLSKIFTFLGPPNAKEWPRYPRLPNSKSIHPMISKLKSNSSAAVGISPKTFPYASTKTLLLLSDLLSYNPSHRPSAEEILSHPYFKEDPRPKPKELFPTFPSKASGERRRRHDTPNAPIRRAGQDQGDDGLVKFGEEEVRGVMAGGIFAGTDEEERGGGFSLRMG